MKVGSYKRKYISFENEAQSDLFVTAQTVCSMRCRVYLVLNWVYINRKKFLLNLLSFLFFVSKLIDKRLTIKS